MCAARSRVRGPMRRRPRPTLTAPTPAGHRGGAAMTAAAYLTRAARTIRAVVETQEPAIRAAGEAVAAARGGAHRRWTFGTDHSHLRAEELYHRAGGLDGVRAVLEPSLMLHEGPG